MPDIKLFYSYSTADEDLRIELEKSLAMLHRFDALKTWDFRKIIPGDDWDKTINKELESSDIILLLLSRDFLASNYCYDVEVKRALELNDEAKAIVVPVVLRQCDWKHEQSPIKGLEGIPKDGKPITLWDDIDVAFNDVTESLKLVIHKIKKQKSSEQNLRKLEAGTVNNEKDSDSLDKIVELFKQEASNLSYNSSKEDFKTYEDLKRELYSKLIGESDRKIDNIPSLTNKLSSLLFEKIYTSEDLDEVTIQELFKFRSNRDSFFWYERKIIVNALALSLIAHKKFNKEKANVLIDFITDFEENVWQTALTGLVLGLIYHQNKWPRFDDFKIRLQTLREIDRVQEGLNSIESIFRNHLYDKVIFNPQFYSNDFFETPANCFLPFYEGNPVLKRTLDNNVTSIDPEYFTQYVLSLPFLDSYKYILCLGLEDNSTTEITLEGDEKKVFSESLNISSIYTPFQNIISEFYCFLTKYPKYKIDNLFLENMSITTTKLKLIILNKTTELLLTSSSLIDSGRYNDAIIKLTDLIKLVPEHKDALWKLSISYISKKKPDYSSAILYLERLEKLDPNNSGVILKIAECYLGYRKIERAREYYYKAFDLKPEGKSALIGLSKFYISLREWENALKYLVEGKKMFPKQYYFPVNIGEYYVIIGDYKKAREYFDEALVISPKEELHHVYTSLSNLNLRLGDAEESLKYAKMALDVKPKDEYIIMNLGRSYLFGAKDFVLARKYLEQAFRRAKNDEIVYGNLGHLELIEGNEEKAIEYYKKFVDLCVVFKDFERFDYDIGHILNLGISKEKYLAIKNMMIEYWNETRPNDK